ncbi:unnamed protein product [Leptosia nina]|uniref:Uncharacterized protein n=1 Tax=Leptosia nina TaxID=320188 RepID=A0AAV1JA78_9NEOP
MFMIIYWVVVRRRTFSLRHCSLRGGAEDSLSGWTGTTSHLAESTSSITSAAGHRSQRGSGITNDLRLRRQSQKAGDIPVFDRNKVSLDLPGSLFGPSVSLLINTTKIVGSVIQNSAVRYQTFLRLFRPLFRGPFEIKGLDPPTTTTTTTTTKLPPIRDNEVRRR